MRHRHVLAAVLLSSVSGCVELQPHVERTASMDPGSGYVAGFFTWSGGVETFALVVSDARGHEHPLRFRDLRADASVSGAGIQMIALPPGDYRVASWTYNALYPPEFEVARTTHLGTPFSLRPGHVVFVGALSSTRGPVAVAVGEPELVGVPMRADEARRLFTRAYPAFAAAPMECLACAAPAPDATDAAAQPIPEAGDFAPSHTIVVHLQSPSGRYLDYDLTAWESVDGSPERRWVTRASPGHPRRPRRVDGFGAAWELTDLDFRDGRVHVATRGAPPRTAEERSWDLARGHEVWLNEGDPEVHFTRAEACAAQAR